MTIQYIEGTNLAYCNGYKFRKDRKTGYWLCSTLGVRLHRYIWEEENGEIPKGYHVHHIDGNKDNNTLNNLGLISASEHETYHIQRRWDEEREKYLPAIMEKSLPKLLEHRKNNPLPKEWHKQHYEKMRHLLRVERKFVCEVCGSEFTSTNLQSRFCSNKCRAKWRRDSGVDDENRVCKACGNEFRANKYSKTFYCSKACAGKAKRKYKTRICEYCGKEYESLNQERRFCGRSCSNKGVPRLPQKQKK